MGPAGEATRAGDPGPDVRSSHGRSLPASSLASALAPPSAVSSLLARAVYGTLARTGLPALGRRWGGGAPVFCFHNVVPSDQVPVGEAALHLGLDDFEEVLAWITATYTVVAVDEVADRVRDGKDVRGLAALTFDDGCRGVYAHAAPLLERAGAPATVFVVSPAPETGALFWWDRLAAAGRLDPETRGRCLDELRGDGRVILPALLGEEAEDPDLPDALRPADWPTLLAGQGRGLALGAHTVTHRNLTRLTDDELRDELETSAGEIGERTGRRPEAFSYPYGLGDARVFEAARAAGYRAAVTLEPGAARPGDDPVALPRVTVPTGIALPVLECWASGVRIR